MPVQPQSSAAPTAPTAPAAATTATPMAARLFTPFPRPNHHNAPKFKGVDIEEFLEDFESLAAHAGIQDTELPKKLVRYCSKAVREVIEHLPQFNAADWDDAKTALRELYESNDRRPKASWPKLLEFTTKTGKNTTFKSRSELDAYTRQFLKLSGDLVSRKVTTDNDINLRFYRGLPSMVRQRIYGKLSSTKTNAMPDIAELLRETRKLYEPDDIDYNTDEDEAHLMDEESDEDSKADDSDDLDSDSEDERPQKHKAKAKGKPAVLPMPAPAVPQPPAEDTLESLTRRMERLTILVEQQQAAQRAPKSKHCWMCDNTDTHPIGYRFCPEAEKLVSEGILKYSSTGKLVRLDGSDLPMVRAGAGALLTIFAQKFMLQKGRAENAIHPRIRA
ncbi:hypothetical protein A0H81_10025 [Grifola frondosa]|uniref:Uncharacterized protein n=1 Tax=Grifola frondosa TaxID=5627 RepID=A0A1C7M0I4_GRIFR|nr:hypothetical protein A0H81_10025 [Grifola frondosa]